MKKGGIIANERSQILCGDDAMHFQILVLIFLFVAIEKISSEKPLSVGWMQRLAFCGIESQLISLSLSFSLIFLSYSLCACFFYQEARKRFVPCLRFLSIDKTLEV
jgi:hypothetical protein